MDGHKKEGIVETAAWISAILTLLAIGTALFKDDLVKLWRHPRLNASIQLSAPDSIKTDLSIYDRRTSEIIDQGECYYLRIWVKNDGNLRAEKVQVFAAKLMRKHADGTFREEKQFLPMNLNWSNAQKDPEIFADGISPLMGKHCDLGHILDPEFRNRLEQAQNSDEARLELDLEVAPNPRYHVLLPGTYRLELRIAAANAKPITKMLEIYLTGNWYSDEDKMFSDGIGLKEIR